MKTKQNALLAIFVLFLVGSAVGFGTALYSTPQALKEPGRSEPFDTERPLFFPTELLFHGALVRSDWSASVKGQVTALTANSFTLREVIFDDNAKLVPADGGETLEVRYAPGETFFVEFPIPSPSGNVEGQSLERKGLGFSDIKDGDVLFGKVRFERAGQNAWQAVGEVFSINNQLKP